MHAQRSKCGLQFMVDFKDDHHNAPSSTFFSFFMNGEHKRILGSESCRIMPIQEWPSSASWSADAGRASVSNKTARLVNRFFSELLLPA